MYKFILIVLLFLSCVSSANAETAVNDYSWCALKSNKVNVRTGPGKRYPIKWVYQRVNLPLMKVAEYDNWIKIEDNEGTTGWVHPSMVSDKQTFMVIEDTVYLNKDASDNVRHIAKLEKGVIGDMVTCEGDLCKVKAGNWEGYVAKNSVWGNKKQNAK